MAKKEPEKPARPARVEMVGPCGRQVVLASEQAAWEARGYERAPEAGKAAERTQGGPRGTPRAIPEED
jgi:hypothetical protein